MRWFRRKAPPEPDDDFLDLLAEHGLAFYERQAAFEQRIAGLDWRLDQDRGIVSVGDDLELPAQILGSEAVRDNTWMWAWANPTVEESLSAKSREARSIGHAQGIEVLTEPQIDTHRAGDGYLLALATCGLLDADAYYPCPYPGGVLYVIVDLGDDVPPLGPPGGERVVRLISMMLEDAPRLASRRAIERYLTTIRADISSSGGSIRISQDATLTFDELGRLTEMQATLQPPADGPTG